jgi:hypothetical protein
MNGRGVSYKDNDNLSTSKHDSTTLERSRLLVLLKTIGDHILIIKHHKLIEIPTLWTSLQIEFEREEVQLLQTVLQEEAHYFPTRKRTRERF